METTKCAFKYFWKTINQRLPSSAPETESALWALKIQKEQTNKLPNNPAIPNTVISSTNIGCWNIHRGLLKRELESGKHSLAYEAPRQESIHRDGKRDFALNGKLTLYLQATMAGSKHDMLLTRCLLWIKVKMSDGEKQIRKVENIWSIKLLVTSST